MKWARRIAFAGAIWTFLVACWIGVGPTEYDSAQAEVAIVLGAAVSGDDPSPVFRERINHAIALYKSGRAQRLLFTGGKAPADIRAESEVARAYAVEAGVPATDILIETSSLTTLQNLSEAKALMVEADLSTALIISDPLHLRRALAMADHLGIDAQASATPTTRYRSLSTQAPFLLRETYFMHHFWFFGQ